MPVETVLKQGRLKNKSELRYVHSAILFLQENRSSLTVQEEWKSSGKDMVRSKDRYNASRVG